MKEQATTTNNKRKQNGYKSNVLWAKRETKKIAAERRNEAYQSLTTQQKIARAKSRRGDSAREIERLTKRLQQEKETAAKVAKPAPLTTAQKVVKEVKHSEAVAKAAVKPKAKAKKTSKAKATATQPS